MTKEINTMSDTPKLDAWIYQGPLTPLQEFAILARQIERELNAANADTERLTAANLQLREGIEALKQHIKRLEEAGDRMVNEGWNEPHLAAEWSKAKEAKP